jgi:hypothetical protein
MVASDIWFERGARRLQSLLMLRMPSLRGLLWGFEREEDGRTVRGLGGG